MYLKKKQQQQKTSPRKDERFCGIYTYETQLLGMSFSRSTSWVLLIDSM